MAGQRGADITSLIQWAKLNGHDVDLPKGRAGATADVQGSRHRRAAAASLNVGLESTNASRGVGWMLSQRDKYVEITSR